MNEWVEVSDCKNGHGHTYEVSRLGRVRNAHTKREISIVMAGRNRDGARVTLGRDVYRYVGRLVLESFVGPCPEGFECSHVDGNPRNNRLVNLKWESHSHNEKRKKGHGTQRLPLDDTRGELNPNTSMLNREIREIKVRLSEGATDREIRSEFGVSQPLVYDIRSGRKWSSVTI